jgi:HPt (histidine-containing phosphotransfer) domain-containing protein
MSTSSPDGPPRYFDIDGALKKIGDLPAIQDLLGMLQISLSRDIPKIEELLAQDNIYLVNRMLHELKGFIPIFCTEALCNEVAAIELLSRLAGSAEVTIAYTELSPKLKQLQGEVAQHICGVVVLSGGVE